MKTIKLSSFIAAGVTAITVYAADTSVTLSKVHLCCNACVKGVGTATAGVTGAKVTADKDAGTVAITAADKATAQKAVDALIAAGYFGASSEADVKVMAKTGAKMDAVKSLEVSGVHLCCGKCVTTVNDALHGVKGVTANTAEKNAKTFTVTGEFSPADVFGALHKAGLTGTAGK